MFPIFVDLRNRPCLVVGAGRVALRKVRALLREGADVIVVSPEGAPEIGELARRGRIRWLRRAFIPADVEGMVLVFCATDRPEVNREVARAARERQVLVNVADDPENCDFFLGSTAQRGPVTVAVSTSGVSPALARHLRERLEKAIPPGVELIAQALGRLRPEVKRRLPAPEARTGFWRKAVKRLMSGRERPLSAVEAEEELRKMLGAICVPEEES